MEQDSSKTRVLYNAACPVCSREINHYADISEKQALPIAYDDLNDASHLDAWGIDHDTAARRLHIRKGSQVLSGIPAFIALWQDIPRYRWLARLVSFPPIKWLASGAYDYILAPLIYRWYMSRRQKLAKKAELPR